MPDPRNIYADIVNVKFGKNVRVVKPVNLYGCTIGDDCFIGPFVDSFIVASLPASST